MALEILVQEKLDGASVSLEYENGNLVRMATRGDGIVGDDVTPNAAFMPSIPKRIPITEGRVFVRGEVVIRLSDFEKIADRFENPRNTAAATIRARGVEDVLGLTTFVGFDLHCSDRGQRLKSEWDIWLRIGELGFQRSEISFLVSSKEQLKQVFEKYDRAEAGQSSFSRKVLPWQTDGLVGKVNDLSLQNKFQTKNNRPGHSIAIKPSPTAVTTTVTGITWQMGLSGRYTAVCHVTPTPMDGVTLRNVNLHNLTFLSKLISQGFSIGSRVRVIRAGDVIPQIVGVVS